MMTSSIVLGIFPLVLTDGSSTVLSMNQLSVTPFLVVHDNNGLLFFVWEGLFVSFLPPK